MKWDFIQETEDSLKANKRKAISILDEEMLIILNI